MLTNTIEARDKASKLHKSLVALHSTLADAGVELEGIAAASDVADDIAVLLGAPSAYESWGA